METKMFRIYFTNFGYWADRYFNSCGEACAFGRTKGFEFSVHFGRQKYLIAAWSPIGGTRHYPLGGK
jgi:hypothetical protein